LRAATINSIPLANATVQVMNDAKAKPTITALTKTSADRNMPHGERSLGSKAAAIGAFAVASSAPAKTVGAPSQVCSPGLLPHHCP
jgi:hypothetical protein